MDCAGKMGFFRILEAISTCTVKLSKKRDSHVILCNETTIKTVFFLLVTELEFQDLYKVLQKVKIRKFWFFQRMH